MYNKQIGIFILLFGIIISIGCSQDKIQSEWIKINSGIDQHLYGVNFVDGKHGWTAGSNGVVLTSKDGGNTWKVSEIQTILKDTITHIDFTTPKNGWLISIGKVYYTGSGGKSWVVQHHERTVADKSPGILDIYFVTKTEGWAVGGFGTVLHTKNGGGKWEKIQTSSEKHLWGVFFVDPEHGWIVGEEGVILHTHDGGKHWESQEADAEQPLFAVHFADHMNGWIVGTNGLILNTDDGGKTWERQTDTLKQTLRDIAFSSEKEGWAVGEEGLILHTTDGGTTWKHYTSPTSNNLQDIHLYKKTGWIVGAKGTILRLN